MAPKGWVEVSMRTSGALLARKVTRGPEVARSTGDPADLEFKLMRKRLMCPPLRFETQYGL
ncbi:predicted protein [Coccidioides posadasii str. Silveira]|uniref:Predicted protein n=1 Tax=Coccidioides posadasii (strain RMSCC 757 / Silveira) TaxID=443226 RepID=E9CWD2_COCPS|nr:predicted protein [Coccidioides posadasii str. Silveira]